MDRKRFYIDETDPLGEKLVWVRLRQVPVDTQELFDNRHTSIIHTISNGLMSSWKTCNRPWRWIELHNAKFVLREDVHLWLKEKGLEWRYQIAQHHYTHSSPGWHVGFHRDDSDVSILFKLTWGSES